jgi:hypothetical protein
MTACHEPTRKGGVPHRGLTQAKVRAMCFSKSPQTPLYIKGGIKWDISHANKSSSPSAKGGSRGILLHLRLPENRCSIFTLRAKLNYTTSIAGGFCKY